MTCPIGPAPAGVATANPNRDMVARDDDDAALLALEAEFNVVAAELAAFRRANDVSLVARADGRPSGPVPARLRQRERSDDEAAAIEAEALLARLDPIERAIMATPARTITGLAVKAHHAAYVTSQYWSAPLAEIDWEARAVRLLIEAVCSVARVPLPFGDAGDTGA